MFKFVQSSLRSTRTLVTSHYGKVALTGVGIGSLGFGSLHADEAPAKDSTPAIREAIASILDQDDYDDGSVGPLLVRLAWHASGTYDKETKTGGSNGATMRFAPEASHGANAGLHIARNILEPIKQAYPEISYGDLWTLAGCVAIEEMGGPKVFWRGGRVDALDESACPPDGRLPDATQGAQHLRDIFYRMGFDDREIVALAGAHCLGRCHTDRSGFSGPWTNAPTTFSNLYFVELLKDQWTFKNWNGPKQYEDTTGNLMMLPGDMAIKDDQEFKQIAEQYAQNENLFFTDFSKAFSKLTHLGVPDRVINQSTGLPEWVPYAGAGVAAIIALGAIKSLGGGSN